MTGALAALLVLHLAAALTLIATPKRFRRLLAATAVAPFTLSLIWAVAAASDAADGTIRTETLDWLPALSVGFDLRIDALAVAFVILISGVGLAIAVFSIGYMKKSAHPGRFLGLMVLFAGSMVGLVASDNVYGLFVFWELTTITSYLLVGFDDEKGSARAAALQAVLTTGLGGLAMLGGLVLLAQEAGTASITRLVADPPTGTMADVALVLVLIGAFTKSAQAPFHFWLPGAMAAPTPASAYLHSATMVKAGILLLLRLGPGFSASDLWTPVIVSVGLVTMVIGAWRALRQTDLKLLLAYGTVSQLGLMTALVGIGTPAMRNAALAMLIGHALFKSALFLTVGAIDATTGTRDIRVLSGLGRRSPVLAGAGALAAASMAGAIPLIGFVTKEAAFSALIDGGEWLVLAIIALASVATVAYSLRFWWGAFATKPVSPEVDAVGATALRPVSTLLLPPLVLAGVGLVAGIIPAPIDRLVSAVAPGVKLVLWPGWKPALAVSAAVVALGVAMHAGRARVAHSQARFEQDMSFLPIPGGEAAYRAIVAGLNRLADRTTGFLQNGSLPVYLAVILTTVVAAPMIAWVAGSGGVGNSPFTASAAELGLAALIGVAALAVIRATGRLAAVLLLGAVGYAMAGIFVIYGAPDLALTLLLVETVTVAIFAFVLTRLPRRFEVRAWRLGGMVRAGVALLVGGFVTAGALIASQQRTGSTLSDAYIDLAPTAGGKNVVNVILTDFRALDTLGEITVIAVAALGVAVLVTGLRTRAEDPS